MSMKKKLLGLATAVAIALPAGAAYANPVSVPVPVGGATTTHAVDMDVNVVGDSGQLQGQVMVDMPTKIAFLVDKTGTIKSKSLEVTNSGASETVSVSVDRFTGAGNKISVVETSTITSAGQATTPRSTIALTLSGNNKSLELGTIYNNSGAGGSAKNDILTVKPNSTESLTLSGISGTQDLGSPNSISDNFQLVFRLSAN